MIDLATHVRRIVADQLGREILDDRTTFIDLDADSLDRISLMLACEQAFCLVISDEEAMEIETVGDLIAYVKEHVE